MKNASHISKQDKILNDNVPENALMFPEQLARAKIFFYSCFNAIASKQTEYFLQWKYENQFVPS